MAILTAVNDAGTATKADIAARTGLSRSTVATAVSELLATGVLITAGGAARARGRIPVRLAMAPPRGLLGAIDLGRQHIGVTVTTDPLDVDDGVWLEHDVDGDPAGALEVAIGLVGDLVRERVGRGPLLALAASVPRPVSDVSGTIAPTPFLTSWQGLDVAGRLRASYDVPVLLENDANAGALSEAGGSRSVAFVKVSTGVGLGIVLDGISVRGSRGQAGEIGHLVVRQDGPLCGCGNRGCLEAIASLAAVARALEPVHGPLSHAGLSRLLEAGDAVSTRAMREAGIAIGTALAPIVAALQVDKIVVDGSRDIPMTAVIRGVRARILELVHPETVHTLSVESSRHGHRASLAGALLLAQSAVRSVR